MHINKSDRHAHQQLCYTEEGPHTLGYGELYVALRCEAPTCWICDGCEASRCARYGPHRTSISN
eukprot:5360380-Alexandrium_andersonii.AAC.1